MEWASQSAPERPLLVPGRLSPGTLSSRHAAAGGEDAVAGQQMGAGSGHQGRRECDEVERFERDRRRAVAPTLAPRADDASVLVEREPVGPDGGTRDIPAVDMTSVMDHIEDWPSTTTKSLAKSTSNRPSLA